MDTRNGNTPMRPVTRFFLSAAMAVGVAALGPPARGIGFEFPISAFGDNECRRRR